MVLVNSQALVYCRQLGSSTVLVRKFYNGGRRKRACGFAVLCYYPATVQQIVPVDTLGSASFWAGFASIAPKLHSTQSASALGVVLRLRPVEFFQCNFLFIIDVVLSCTTKTGNILGAPSWHFVGNFSGLGQCSIHH